jgi:hypothetical protein
MLGGKPSGMTDYVVIFIGAAGAMTVVLAVLAFVRRG